MYGFRRRFVKLCGEGSDNTAPQEIAGSSIGRLPRPMPLIPRKLTRERSISRQFASNGCTEAGEKFTDEAWTKLSQRERNLYAKSIQHERSGSRLAHADSRCATATATRNARSTGSKGDVLHQFREDKVMHGKLPAVSWIVPPENILGSSRRSLVRVLDGFSGSAGTF